MNKRELLYAITQKAKRDARNRRDPRYIATMGFLVAKGFLHTNQPIPKLPSGKVRIADAVWAGKNVEPRILEVLPAAVLRLPSHFDLDANRIPELYTAVENLRRNTPGEDFYGVPYVKYQIWAELQLPDKRTKSPTEKRVVKTFRLSPKTVELLRKRSQELGVTETEILEKAILK